MTLKLALPRDRCFIAQSKRLNWLFLTIKQCRFAAKITRFIQRRALSASEFHYFNISGRFRNYSPSGMYHCPYPSSPYISSLFREAAQILLVKVIICERKSFTNTEWTLSFVFEDIEQSAVLQPSRLDFALWKAGLYTMQNGTLLIVKQERDGSKAGACYVETPKCDISTAELWRISIGGTSNWQGMSGGRRAWFLIQGGYFWTSQVA